jgi:tRNA(adenine34) deaminase
VTAASWFGATDEHERLMRLALAEADRAVEHGDVPVGALVLRDGELIASRHNERELSGDPTAHAEVLALRDAAERLGTWRLEDCTVVVTLEPCLMCAGAMVNARVAQVVYGAADMKAGACLSLYNVCDDPRLNHRIELVPAVLEDECGALLTRFFASQR